MRTAKFFIMILALLGYSIGAIAHGDDESPVALELSSSGPISAGKSLLSFQMVTTKSNKLITDLDLNVVHEKKLHMFIYDVALNEFQHLHPNFTASTDSSWEVEVDFRVNGNYWIWVQGELSSDGSEFSAASRQLVTGGAPQMPASPLIDTRSGYNKVSAVSLSKTPLRAGKMAMLEMTFSRVDGSAAQISPYLGAVAHVVSTPSDGDSLIHVHPMAGSSPEKAMLHVTFPAPGLYRLWVQFVDAGILNTIPLVVEVK